MVQAQYNQAHCFYDIGLRGKARYQRGHSTQYSDFKLAVLEYLWQLPILEFFTATSHKHCAFTITYDLV